MEWPRTKKANFPQTRKNEYRVSHLSKQTHGSTTNKVNKKSMSTQISFPALQSYFSTLTSERKQQLQGRVKKVNIMVVVDNAHIPLGGDFHNRNVKGDDITEKLSKSLSAMDTISFPPNFLLDDGSCSSRWDSMEGRAGMCNEFDSALRKPSRSRDDSYDGKEEARILDECIDRTFHQRQISPVPKKRTRRLLKNYPGGEAFRSYSSPHPSSSLDSTTRWLRELPSRNVGDSSLRGLHRRLDVSDHASTSARNTPEKLTKDKHPNALPCRSPHLCGRICWCAASKNNVDLDPAVNEDMGRECRDTSSTVNMRTSVMQPKGSQRKLASHEAPDQVYLRIYSSKRGPPPSVLEYYPLSCMRFS